jgi:DNA/RNA-binding domain of Phe-tRNA-synthetase-like protein
MKFIVSSEILNSYPNVRIGIVVATGIKNQGQNKELLDMLKSTQEDIKSNFSLHSISENETISRWRSIYSSFKSKPSDYRCSIEALIRSVLNGREIRHINNLVDIYNFISLKHTIPAGGEDLDKINGDLFLMFSNGEENFIPLGSVNIEVSI